MNEAYLSLFPPFLSDKNTTHIVEKLIQEIQKDHSYQSKYAFCALPTDTDLQNNVQELSASLKRKNLSAVVLIGIGGSNLGFMALFQALQRAHTNQIAVYNADTVDQFSLQHTIKEVTERLQKQERIALIVVTKSGTTTETIVNLEIFLHVLMKYHPDDYADYVVCITDEHSPLDKLAAKKDFETLYIPKEVGGRFSVMSAAGLLPLSVVGINISELLSGAEKALADLFSKETNCHSAQTALWQFMLYQKDIRIHNMFLFSPLLENLGKWYRQLVSESLGKQFDSNNKEVRAGILPIISIGSTDLHSMYQLYMAGPQNFFTTFVSITSQDSQLKVPNLAEFESLVPRIQDRSISVILDAILKGTIASYKKQQLPFAHIQFPLSPFALGYFMQQAMLEIIILAKLMNINPFNQPQVELYKTETRFLLDK